MYRIYELAKEGIVREDSLSRNPTDPKRHNLKAQTLIKIAQETRDCYIRALKCYDEAVALTAQQNPVYLANRAKLRYELGMQELARSDIDIIRKLQKDNYSTDELDWMYIEDVLKIIDN